MSIIKFSKVATIPNDFDKNELHFYTDNEETLVAALTTEDGLSYHTTPTGTNIQTIVNVTIDNATGIANGISPLNSNRKIPIVHMPGSLLPILGKITGPLEVVSSNTVYYNIVEYSSFKNYSISVNHGFFSINDGVITYTAPDTIGSSDITDVNPPPPLVVTITINGNDHHINVVWPIPYVLAPTITSPVNNATGLGPSITFITNTFTAMYGNDTHLSTDWELATNSSFTTIVNSSYNDTANKTQWTVNNLTAGTTYYIRARHKGTALGNSAYGAYNTLSTRMLYDIGSETAILTIASPTKNDNLGYSVSMSGDGTRVAVGAPFVDKYNGVKDDGHGVVVIYKWSGVSWNIEAVLMANDSSKNQYLGVSVSMTEDATRIVAGAYRTNVSGKSNAGAAYVFARSGTSWTQEAKLVASDPNKNIELGTSVAISDNGATVVAGAARGGDGYIFTRNGTSWSQQQKISSGGNFGISCAIAGDGTRCVFGRSNTSNGNTYIYRLSGTTWVLEQSITVSSGLLDSAGYGVSVSMNIDGSKIAGGASKLDGTALFSNDMGAVFIHTRTGTNWTEHSKLVASNGSSNDNFGSSVYMTRSGYGVIVGSVGSDPNGVFNAGSAYVYSLNNNVWNEESVLTAINKGSGYNFGFAVTMSNDGSAGAVSSIYEDVSSVDKAGAVHIFR